MYELFHETKRVKTVARRLNERGYRTRRGGLFTAAAIYHLLFDPTAKGVFRMNYTTTRSGKKTLKPEHEWVYHSVPAIVSEELWHACTAHLDERREGMRPGRGAVHLFTGLTYCTCGKKMYVVSDSPKYVCQKCRTKITTDNLEAVFVERLQGLVFSPESAAEQLAGMEGRSPRGQTSWRRCVRSRRSSPWKLTSSIACTWTGTSPGASSGSETIRSLSAGSSLTGRSRSSPAGSTSS
jgi:site-specific DNA recombinase